jgi:hypothetical protein
MADVAILRLEALMLEIQLDEQISSNYPHVSSLIQAYSGNLLNIRGSATGE